MGHEITIMMCHEMTMGTTWDENYDAPWNDYGNYMRWRLWWRHEMTTGTTWDDKYDVPWNDYGNYMRWQLWWHHEMTRGTTWDDDYDGAVKWLREQHEMTIMMAPWNDYGNNMRWRLWWRHEMTMGTTWEHAKVTRNYTELLDFISKKFKKIVLWSEAWF